MYAAAPTSVLDHMRTLLRENKPKYLTLAASRVVASDADMRTAFAFLEWSLLARSRKEPAWTGATNDLTAASTILTLRESAGRVLTPDQADLFARAAIGVMAGEIRNGKPLRVRFLAAALLLIAVLRHREADRAFLAPPRGRLKGHPLHAEAVRVIQRALDEIAKGRKRHDIVAETLPAVLDALNQRGDMTGLLSKMRDGVEGDAENDDDDGEADG
jgi:hypothetical protein